MEAIVREDTLAGTRGRAGGLNPIDRLRWRPAGGSIGGMSGGTSEDRVVRSTSARDELEEWALVLASAGIAHSVQGGDPGWQLLVEDRHGEQAEEALAAYDAERGAVVAPDEAADRADSGSSLAGVVTAALMILLFRATGSESGAHWWNAGRASVDLIRKGEVWRAATALTLHVDPAHVLSNAAAALVFVTATARILGPGLGCLLVIVAGVGGNLLNASLRAAPHYYVGASTAIFGAIGLLGGLETGRRRRRSRAWLPIAGSLALLAMLGTGERADLLAHLCGVLVGSILGVAVALAGRPVPGPMAQAALGLIALALVGGSWLLALR
jgi:membrane associated rhomboid family serine protease